MNLRSGPRPLNVRLWHFGLSNRALLARYLPRSRGIAINLQNFGGEN